MVGEGRALGSRLVSPRSIAFLNETTRYSHGPRWIGFPKRRTVIHSAEEQGIQLPKTTCARNAHPARAARGAVSRRDPAIPHPRNDRPAAGLRTDAVTASLGAPAVPSEIPRES